MLNTFLSNTFYTKTASNPTPFLYKQALIVIDKEKKLINSPLSKSDTKKRLLNTTKYNCSLYL